MRIQSLILICVAAAFVGGGLMGLSAMFDSLALTAVLSVMGLVVGAAPVGWCLFKVRRGFMSMNFDTDTSEPTGIAELDACMKAFQHTMQQHVSGKKEFEEAADELYQLVCTLDRRDAISDDQPMNAHLDQLRGLLSSMGEDFANEVGQLMACGEEIERSTEQLGQATEKQNSVVSKTTAFVEQLSLQIQAIFDNVETAVDACDTASNTIESGLEEIKRLIEEVTEIRDRVATREKRLRELGQHTNEISSIVETIGAISSRTDLLALNASIESVRAGEHGRGFAVVAEEVRKLAEQAAAAAKDVSSRIGIIQKETQQSIDLAVDEHAQFNKVLDRVTSARYSLSTVQASTSTSASSASAISESTKLQLKLTQEVVLVMEELSNTSKEGRSKSESVRWTAKSLLNVGKPLEDCFELLKSLGGYAAPRTRSKSTGNETKQIDKAQSLVTQYLGNDKSTKQSTAQVN